MGTNCSNYPTLLRNESNQILTYGSVNGGYHPISNPVAVDGNYVHRKMSSARRFFILLTVFDVLFTFLVWIISTMVSCKTTIAEAFKNEVIYYSIKYSMFDIVVLALTRLFLIVLFYVFIRLSHWWVVFVTTAGSTAFIISKVFFYEWDNTAKTPAVVLLLCSFILSWGEAWFMDFRVIPSENKALSFLVNSLASQDVERVPVLSHQPLSRSQSDDGSAFYSPPDSDGEDSVKEHDRSTISEVEWLSPKTIKDCPVSRPSDYQRLGEEALEKALAIVQSEGWRKEKCTGEDVIYSKHVIDYGKVFKFVGNLPGSPDRILEEIYVKIDGMHKWNPTVKKARVVERIDDHIDIAHVIATEGAAGLVSSRDFVNLRIWNKQGSVFVHASIATTHPDLPPSSKYVRGEQGPCVYIMAPSSETAGHCNLQWLLNTDLKGWIPQYLIDQTLSTVMMDYVQALRKNLSQESV